MAMAMAMASSSSSADAAAATSWFDKIPNDMSMKELKLAICNTGLRNECVGFLEKSEFISLLKLYLDDVHGQDECPVCFTAMNFGLKSILLSCKHRLCENCLCSIVTRDDISCSCPLCRASVSNTSLAIGLKGASLAATVLIGGYTGDDSNEIVDRYETQLREALRRDPHHAGLLTSLSDLVLEKNGDIDQAGMLSRRAIYLEPNSPYGFASLGNVFKTENNMPEALRCFKKAVSLKEDPNIMINLVSLISPPVGAKHSVIFVLFHSTSYHSISWGITYATMGNYDAAIATLRRSLELASDNVMALLILGITLVVGDVDINDEAIHVLERALALDALGYNQFPPGAYHGCIMEVLVDARERKSAKC